MEKKKKIKIVFVICLVIIILIVGLNVALKCKIKKVVELPINEIQLSNIKNGKYEGEFSSFPVYVKVEVSISDGRISNIDILEHRNGKGKKAEALVDKIIDEQKLDVDAVSGATVSSKCIIKAVEDALIQKKN